MKYYKSERLYFDTYDLSGFKENCNVKIRKATFIRQPDSRELLNLLPLQLEGLHLPDFLRGRAGLRYAPSLHVIRSFISQLVLTPDFTAWPRR
jgi:hypothetical protein